MRVVLQRVSTAAVRVEGRPQGSIALGHVLLVAFTEGDDDEALTWMADKVVGLRVFPDEEGRMNRSLEEVGGDLLVVSQFTLYGDARKGRRPSFVRAAHPDVAIPLWRRFLEILAERAPGRLQHGEFGAAMEVELVNQGPVTLVIDR